jgi:hypothetical protein
MRPLGEKIARCGRNVLNAVRSDLWQFAGPENPFVQIATARSGIPTLRCTRSVSSVEKSGRLRCASVQAKRSVALAITVHGETMLPGSKSVIAVGKSSSSKAEPFQVKRSVFVVMRRPWYA